MLIKKFNVNVENFVFLNINLALGAIVTLVDKLVAILHL
jgi:hypothetical protein